MEIQFHLCSVVLSAEWSSVCDIVMQIRKQHMTWNVCNQLDFTFPFLFYA
jgi:hypothetical protein